MAEERQTGPGLLGNNWILLAIVAFGAVYASFQTPPLTGSRPAGVQLDLHDHRGSQQVDARLWQDPLAATVEYAKVEEKDQVHKKNPRAHSIEEFTEILGERKPLVVGVTIPGAPYTEDSELRRRLRYAIVAALNVTGYAPEDSEHLGYFKHYNILRSAEELPVPTVIPFEWYERYKNTNIQDANTKWVVVLWIDESRLGSQGHPLWYLVSLLCAFEPQEFPKEKITFILIGPQTSGTLRNMISDISDDRTSAWQPKCREQSMFSVLENSFIYNFGATAATPSEREFTTKHINYYRSISTDDDLAKVLVEELHQRRGVDPDKDTPSQLAQTKNLDHIAFVSEWDTVYGRNLPEAITKCFIDCNSTASVNTPPPPWAHYFSYLRGLDGQLPHTKISDVGGSPRDQSGTYAGSKPDSSLEARSADGRERAEGQGQFDYLRRLAGQIRALDEKLRRHDHGRIAAIGILGSDVYDKLVLLQALRPELPEAQFFTTDLDALLLPQGKFRQSRNVLVASSFGLNLREERQANVPPFRDTYQTSVFLATQLAIRNGWLHGPSSADIAKRTGEKLGNWLKPKLYEIGRTAAFALPINEADRDLEPLDESRPGDPDQCRDDVLKCNYI